MTQQIDRATVPNTTMQSSIADGFHPDGQAGSSCELSAAHGAPELCNGSKDSPAPLPDASVSARLRLRQMTHRYRRFMAAGKNSDIGVDCKRRCRNTRPATPLRLLSGCPIAFGSRQEPPRRPRPEPAIHPHFWAMDFVSSSFSPPFGLGLISRPTV